MKKRISDEQREAIIQSFIALNKTTDIKKISISLLMSRLGQTRSNFYNYFDDIYDVRTAAEEIVIQALQSSLPNAPSYCPDPGNFMENSVRKWFRTCLDYRESLQAFLGPFGDPTFRQILVDQWLTFDTSTMNMDGVPDIPLRYCYLYYLAEGNVNFAYSWVTNPVLRDVTIDDITQLVMGPRMSTKWNTDTDTVAALSRIPRLSKSIVGTFIISTAKYEKFTNNSFYDSIFTEKEKFWALESRIPQYSFMVYYAGKRAVLQAIGITENITDETFRNIEITKCNFQLAGTILSGLVLKSAQKKGIMQFSIHYSFDENYTVAVAIGS